MALEFWILLALALAGILAAVAVKLRGKRRTQQDVERNVYPLW